MVTEHEPPLSQSAREPSSRGPLAVRVEPDGTGSASFDWLQVRDVLISGLEQRVRAALGHHVAVVGVRFIDADGRAIAGPAPNGVTLVGFTTTQ
jgi:hypothetical protein